MKPIEVAIVGHIGWNHDITPIGEKTSPGGAVYYSAVGAARYSENVGAVGRVGRDFDLSYLRRRKIDVEGVRVIPGGKTCRFVLTQHADNTREFEAQWGVAGVIETEIFPERYFSAQFIHLPTQPPAESLQWLDFLAQHPGVSVDSFEAFVQQFPDLTKEMFRRSAIIFTNEAEWDILNLQGEEFAQKPLIIKRGKQGAVYRHGQESITIAAPQVQAVETSGAGDVLAGAFLALRSQGVSVEIALSQAVHTASQSVIEFGVEHLPILSQTH